MVRNVVGCDTAEFGMAYRNPRPRNTSLQPSTALFGGVELDPAHNHPRFGLRKELLPLLLLSIVIVGLWIPRWAGPLDLRWDGAVYYILGTSIAEGKGYRLLHEPGEIEAVSYPPLLPLLAAATQTVLGTSDPVVVGRGLKLFFFTFLASLTIANFFMLKVFVPRWLAFFGALAFLLNVQTTFHSNLFFAEIPFGLVTVLFVLINRRSGSRVHAAMSAGLAVMAFLLRTAGVALLAAWIAESLLRKNFKHAALRLLISGLPVLCWTGFVFHVERSPSYTSPAYPYQRAPYLNYNVSYATSLSLADSSSHDTRKATAGELATRFWQNFRGMGLTLGEALSESREFWRHLFRFRTQRFPLSTETTDRLFCFPLILLGGFTLGGMVVLFWRGEIFIPLYALFSVILMCATPWPDQFRRYLVPVAPFLLAGLFTCLLAVANGLSDFWPKLVRRGTPIALTGILALIFGSELSGLYLMYRKNLDRVRAETYDGRLVNYHLFYDSSTASLDSSLGWLKEKARSEEVIATDMPHWAYVKTGMKAVRPPLEQNHERAQALLDSVPVAYVVLDESDGESKNKYIRPVVEGNPRLWKAVYDKGTVRIYQRVRMEDRGQPKQRSAIP